MVEHATENRGVGSSILPLGTLQARHNVPLGKIRLCAEPVSKPARSEQRARADGLASNPATRRNGCAVLAANAPPRGGPRSPREIGAPAGGGGTANRFVAGYPRSDK